MQARQLVGTIPAVRSMFGWESFESHNGFLRTMPIQPSTKYRFGKICVKHPHLNGWRRNLACVECAKANTKKPERHAKRLKINKMWRRKYTRGKYKTDIDHQLRRMLRSRLRNALDGKKKATNTLKLLGCTVEYFREHLEKQFLPGMTWTNRGQWRINNEPVWHVDHIKPCVAFDLTKPEQQQECFHYSNLQPLWGVDNLRKGVKQDNVHDVVCQLHA